MWPPLKMGEKGKVYWKIRKIVDLKVVERKRSLIMFNNESCL